MLSEHTVMILMVVAAYMGGGVSITALWRWGGFKKRVPKNRWDD